MRVLLVSVPLAFMRVSDAAPAPRLRPAPARLGGGGAWMGRWRRPRWGGEGKGGRGEGTRKATEQMKDTGLRTGGGKKDRTRTAVIKRGSRRKTRMKEGQNRNRKVRSKEEDSCK